MNAVARSSRYKKKTSNVSIQRRRRARGKSRNVERMLSRIVVRRRDSKLVAPKAGETRGRGRPNGVRGQRE